MKSEKGSVTIYVTIACLFVLIIGIANYVLLTNKQVAQAEMVNEIEKQYNSSVSLEQTYNSYNGGEIIPIDSLENFKKIGTGEKVYINGKVYTFGTDSTYVLQTNLTYDGNYDDMITRIKNNNIVVTGDGYEIAVTKDGVTDYYVSKWNYTVPRGKVYGSLYKISDDEYHLIFNASGNLAKGYTEEQLVYADQRQDISNSGLVDQDENENWVFNAYWLEKADKITKVRIEEEIMPTSTEGYFYGLTQIKEIEGMQNLNTSEVTNMRLMFYKCNNLTNLEVNHFNTSKVTNMRGVFSKCTNLASLDLSSFNTSNVTTMYCMFYECTSLTNLDLSSFNTSNVETMASMFDHCTSLTNLNLSSFNTAKVTDMYCMFYQCTSLTSLDISSFNTSNVETMRSMFDHCTSLTNLNLSSFNTSNVTDMYCMFYQCTSLITIYVGNGWTTSAVAESTSMFNHSTNLVGAISYDSTKLDATYANWKTGYLTYAVWKDNTIPEIATETRSYVSSNFSSWTLSGGAYVDGNGYLVIPSSTAVAYKNFRAYGVTWDSMYKYKTLDNTSGGIIEDFYYYSQNNTELSKTGKRTARAHGDANGTWKDSRKEAQIAYPEAYYTKVRFFWSSSYVSKAYVIKDFKFITDREASDEGKIIYVTATDEHSGVKLTKWISGTKTISDFKSNGTEFTNWFTVTENGTYTIYAEDNNGNGNVKVVTITGISK
ncbi:MAG: BspA family leucine-rich repeat surface protein [Clostridia bacterium]|nr:BspA family leucine-rich repeat surface protein [Clostridia bacterium]